MSQSSRQCYTFGPFLLDPQEQLLLRDGVPVALTRKAFETLLMLVERGGHVVDKEEFLTAIWPDAFVEEGSLTVNISVLRKALGEDKNGERYIETVPRRGYRFVAPVERLNGTAPAATEQTETAAPRAEAEITSAAVDAGAESGSESVADNSHAAEADAPHTTLIAATGAAGVLAPPAPVVPRAGRRRLLIMLVLVAAVGGALFVAVRARRQKTARVDNQPRTLAILPFVNLKPDADSDFLSFSLADAINAKLGNIHTLTVRPSASVSKYRNQTPDPNKVADELHVNTLLTGTYLKEGDELRINAQLIDVRDNKIVRQYATTLKYERLSTVQDEVALHVLEELGLTLTPAELERLQAENDRPALAYEYYLRGVDYYYAEDYLKAIEALKESVALDANYAPAWARLGSAYSVHGSLNFGGREFYDRAQAAYERALALDPNQREARAFLADLLVDTGRFEQAVPLLRTVLDTHLDDALARWELSYAYRFGGMLEQSIAEGERSRAADPNLELASAPFSAYLYTGQYERFIQSLQRADSSGLLTFYRGLGFYYLQDWAHATTDFDRAYELDPSLLAAQVGHALRFGLSGQKAEGVKVLRQVEARIDQSGVIDGESLYKVAQAYAVLGDRAASLRMLRRSIKGGFVCYPYFTSDPLLANIRTDSAYAAIIEQARVRHEEFKRKFF